MSVLYIYFMGFLHLESIFRLSGQNFFFLYALCTAAYFKLAKGAVEHILSLIGLLIVLSMSIVFGWGMLYPLSLLFIGYSIAHFMDIKNKD